MQASKRLLIYLLVAFECFYGRWSQRDLPTQHWMTVIYISEAFSQPTKNFCIHLFHATLSQKIVCGIRLQKQISGYEAASFQEVLNQIMVVLILTFTRSAIKGRRWWHFRLIQN